MSFDRQVFSCKVLAPSTITSAIMPNMATDSAQTYDQMQSASLATARDKVVQLALALPDEKVVSALDYLAYLASQPVKSLSQLDLQREWLDWDAASDEDWQTLETRLAESGAAHGSR